MRRNACFAKTVGQLAICAGHHHAAAAVNKAVAKHAMMMMRTTTTISMLGACLVGGGTCRGRRVQSFPTRTLFFCAVLFGAVSRDICVCELEWVETYGQRGGGEIRTNIYTRDHTFLCVGAVRQCGSCHAIVVP